MTFINARDIQFSYKNKEKAVKAIDGLSFSIEEGSFTAILGVNGSGKSTLAKMLNALIVPDKGQLLVNGLDTSDSFNTTEIRKTVGIVFQNPESQIISDTVEDEVAFGPENLGLETYEIENRVTEALNSVYASDLRLCEVSCLSGGQKQKIAIASVLAMESKCIVLDESTSMLDPEGRKEVLSCLHKLNKEQGITIVLITHYVEECIDCDNVFLMDKGKIILDGSPKKVFSSYEIFDSLKLKLPLVCEISRKLAIEGFDIENCISEDELVDELKRVGICNTK